MTNCKFQIANCESARRGPQVADGVMVGMIFDCAINGSGLVVCGWCKRWMGTKRGLPTGAVSHGVCPACEARLMADFAEVESWKLRVEGKDSHVA